MWVALFWCRGEVLFFPPSGWFFIDYLGLLCVFFIPRRCRSVCTPNVYKMRGEPSENSSHSWVLCARDQMTECLPATMRDNHRTPTGKKINGAPCGFLNA
uniref:Uncharacterized protein n=1 Tax=Sphaerodactylus townsendi TaxID=933632 RepID=A0ACB8EUE8_9SAUR